MGRRKGTRFLGRKSIWTGDLDRGNSKATVERDSEKTLKFVRISGIVRIKERIDRIIERID